MYNKRLFVLLGMVVCVCFNFLGLSCLAINLDLGNVWKIIDEDDFKKKVSIVHFKNVKGNDFGGFIYFNQLSGGLSSATSVNVGEDSVTYNCRQPVEGFYYNEERGDRLWPLDEKTANTWGMADDVNFSGGIYTRCILSGYEAALQGCADLVDQTEDQREECEREVKKIYRDTYGYYGFVEHEYSGQKLKLVVGTDYKNLSGWVVLSGSLEPSLIRIGNKFPLGFVYDYNGGVGFVGCKVIDDVKEVFEVYNGGSSDGNSKWDNFFKVNDGYTGIDLKSEVGMGEHVSCNNIAGSAKDTLLSIVVEGIVGIGRNYNDAGYVGNQGNTKMQLFSSVDVNNTTLINYAKQKAETLCRGKWINGSPTFLPSSTHDLVCINGPCISDVDASDEMYSLKTLIVKGCDVKVKPDIDKVYNIFIDSGSLLIDETEDDNQYVISNNGFISDDLNKNKFLVLSFIYTNKGGFDGAAVDAAGLISLAPDECKDIIPSVDCECGSFGPYQRGLCKHVDTIGNKDGRLDEEHDLNNFRLLLMAIGGEEDFNYSAVASVIKGNFIVNGRVRRFGANPFLDNKYFIYGKFTTKDTFSDLERTFTWRCDKGTDTNGVPCLQLGGNPYSNAALSIIDQNYDSPLFK